jgi:primosomal protein N' (replication factor Y)
VVELLQERPAALGDRRASAIEGLQQPAAVDPHWQQLVEAVAHDCRTTPFRALKAACPPVGWGSSGNAGPVVPSARPGWS